MRDLAGINKHSAVIRNLISAVAGAGPAVSSTRESVGRSDRQTACRNGKSKAIVLISKKRKMVIYSMSAELLKLCRACSLNGLCHCVRLQINSYFLSLELGSK